jgi:P27 family predicted phage terminase small subunit
MGQRGPLPHKAKGKPTRERPRRASKEIVVSPNGGPSPLPAMPEHLGEAGAAQWRAAASAPWLCTAADFLLLEHLAEAVDERHQLRDMIAEGGRIAHGSTGQPVTAPPVEQLRAVEAQIHRLASMLGLGAGPRARLGVAIRTIEEKDARADREVAEIMAEYENA